MRHSTYIFSALARFSFSGSQEKIKREQVAQYIHVTDLQHMHIYSYKFVCVYFNLNVRVLLQEKRTFSTENFQLTHFLPIISYRVKGSFPTTEPFPTEDGRNGQSKTQFVTSFLQARLTHIK